MEARRAVMGLVRIPPEMFEGASPSEKADIVYAFADLVAAANPPMGLPAGIALAVLSIAIAWIFTTLAKNIKDL